MKERIYTEEKNPEKEILSGLISLGYSPDPSTIIRENCGYRRERIFLNGKEIGIYDLDRHTFVD